MLAWLTYTSGRWLDATNATKAHTPALIATTAIQVAIRDSRLKRDPHGRDDGRSIPTERLRGPEPVVCRCVPSTMCGTGCGRVAPREVLRPVLEPAMGRPSARPDSYWLIELLLTTRPVLSLP